MAATDDVPWAPSALPEDPAECRQIRVRFVILAAGGVLAQIQSVAVR